MAKDKAKVDRDTRNFVRGYFCAVAVLLKEEGRVTTLVHSLFGQGGSAKDADPEDIAVFVEYGLMDLNRETS